MAALYRLRQRRRLRRPKIYRDRTNPLDTFDDIELHDKLRFRRQDILELTDLLTNDLELDNRGGAVPPVLQVCVTLRYFATGTFQNAIGEMIGISQPTVSLIVKRTMNALLQRFPDFIHPPAMQDITRNKIEFQEMAGFPNVFGCIDGTHIKIVAPPGIDEDVYVNRKNVHSINVQIVCDARLRILDCVATSPGSFHDARILRESAFWRAMEGEPRAVPQGLILGDSAYPIREWLMTPYAQPVNRQQERFNVSHKSTRVTVERCIGVLKRRWHCLHTELRLSPLRCSRLIYCCAMLHNFAVERAAQQEIIPFQNDAEPQDHPPPPAVMGNDRARMVAGQVVRNRLTENFF